MGSNIKKHLLPYLFFVFCICSFVSCNQNYTELLSTSFKVVFSYENKNELPKSSLSIYTQTSTDPRLIKSLKIENLQTNYIWNIDNVDKIQKENNTYAGCSNLKVPEEKEIPDGVFKIIYTNHNGDNFETSSELNYDKSFYTKKIDDLVYTDGEDIIKKIAIYTDDNTLIYYGERTEEYANVQSIKNLFNNAANCNEVWIYSGRNEIIIFPEEKIDSDL